MVWAGFNTRISSGRHRVVAEVLLSATTPFIAGAGLYDSYPAYQPHAFAPRVWLKFCRRDECLYGTEGIVGAVNVTLRLGPQRGAV